MNIRQLISAFLTEGQREAVPPELQAWLDADAQNRADFEAYCKIWDDVSDYFEMKNFDVEKAWRRVREVRRRKEKTRRTRLNAFYYTVSAAAAVALIVLSLTLSHYVKQSRIPEIPTVMLTEYGSRSNIVLPDGTKVLLNSGSYISYVYDKKNKTRTAMFNGEGLFEVAKDAKNPFVISLAVGLKINVLGTTFNLMAYDNEQTVEVALTEGVVEMRSNGRIMTLKPGETGKFDKSSFKLSKSEKTPAQMSGWLDNKIYMDKMSLAELFRRMERMYNVKIHYESDFGDTICYGGVLQEETVTDLLEALKKQSNIKYKIKGKDIYINPK
jgi:ferric-dicitrate binding protein FerR (iron transport regulator)